MIMLIQLGFNSPFSLKFLRFPGEDSLSTEVKFFKEMNCFPSEKSAKTEDRKITGLFSRAVFAVVPVRADCACAYDRLRNSWTLINESFIETIMGGQTGPNFGIK